MSEPMELEPVDTAPVIRVRRGRPRKDSPLVYDGVELLSGEEMMRHRENVAAMRDAMQKVRSAGQELVAALYAVGETIRRTDMGGRKNLPMTEHMRMLGISEAEFRAASKVYNAYRDAPEELSSCTAEGLTSLSKVMRHFREAERRQAEPAGQVVFPQRPVSWSDVERLPQAANGALRHYRIRAEPTDGNFYIYHNDDLPVPIAQMMVDLPRNFQQEAAFERLRDKIQVALEEYYAVIEATEEDWT